MEFKKPNFLILQVNYKSDYYLVFKSTLFNSGSLCILVCLFLLRQLSDNGFLKSGFSFFILYNIKWSGGLNG